MVKSPMLVERLDKALSLTNSDKDVDLVYGLLYRVARSAFGRSVEAFYFQDLKGVRLSPTECSENFPSSEEVNGGRELGLKLREEIILPEYPYSKKFKKRYNRQRHREHDLIKRYFSNKDGGEEEV